MDLSEQNNNQAILQDWYRYAAEQPWTVDAYLRLVRVHEFKMREQQRNEFGANPEEFLRLQAMPLPGETSFVLDTQRIAQACNLQNARAFIQTMLLARQLATAPETNVADNEYYEAAFDALEDLDDSERPENG